MDQVVYDKRVARAWTLYDWANSVYNLVITATLFPIYFTLVTEVDGNSDVDFFGFTIKNTVLYDYSIALAYLIMVLVLPLLSGIADASGSKKKFMQIFMLVGAASCSGLYFFNEHNITYGILIMITAVVGYAGSLVFYNAFLPEIAPAPMHDRLSARGFAMGYLGSSLMLIGSLVFVLMPELIYNSAEVKSLILSNNPGISPEVLDDKISAYYFKGTAPYIFLAVGIWWLLFGYLSTRKLPDNVYKKKLTGSYLLKGYREIAVVTLQLRNLPALKRFLGGFFFFSMATQTIMLVAVIFAKKEIGTEGGMLILTILIIQFVGIAGAYVFSAFSRRTYNLFTLRIALIIWIIICLSAYFVENQTQFFFLAGTVGFVMGGTQSLSRSTYSKLLPETTNHASFFSFYDITEKLGIVLGLLLFGVIDSITGSMRNATIALSALYLIGLLWLYILPSVPGVTSPKLKE